MSLSSQCGSTCSAVRQKPDGGDDPCHMVAAISSPADAATTSLSSNSFQASSLSGTLANKTSAWEPDGAGPRQEMQATPGNAAARLLAAMAVNLHRSGPHCDAT